MDAVVIQPGVDTGEPSVSGVSWPAVAAGAVVSCALTLVLLAFGIGLGLSVVSPWSGAGVSATTFKIGTGLYLDRHCHALLFDRWLHRRPFADAMDRRS